MTYISKFPSNIPRFPEAAVSLENTYKTIGVLFRACGFDGTLQIKAMPVSARENFIEQPWRIGKSLYMPPVVEFLPESSLNHDLALWWSVFAAIDYSMEQQQIYRFSIKPLERYMLISKQTSQLLLQKLPGLEARYQRLQNACMKTREQQPWNRQTREQAQSIDQLLQQPEMEQWCSTTQFLLYPVLLWLHPDPPKQEIMQHELQQQQKTAEKIAEQQAKVENPEEEPEKNKPTSLLQRIDGKPQSVKTAKPKLKSKEQKKQQQNLRLSIYNSIMRMTRSFKKDLQKCELNLSVAPLDADGLPLEYGHVVKEWDYKQEKYLERFCRIRVREMGAKEGVIPDNLRYSVQRVKKQFEALTPRQVWLKNQLDGEELDIDAFVQFMSERQSKGVLNSDQGLYRRLHNHHRDLSCFLLADLSISTDIQINPQTRIIDIIRDSLFLFSEALAKTGDDFAIYGFSSKTRECVNLHAIKRFEEPHNGRIRGRIEAIYPGFYTRMGAAIRYASEVLSRRNATQRLLIILTDGKPNDQDHYLKKYGIEDTRKAVIEAKTMGLQPFCVTVDKKGSQYLPHLFGAGHFMVVRRLEDLPQKLPALYAAITCAR